MVQQKCSIEVMNIDIWVPTHIIQSFLADHNMPPPHYDFLIKVSGLFSIFWVLTLTTQTTAPAYRWFWCVSSHTFYAVSEPRTVRCGQVLPSPPFLRRCMDSFLYHNDWYWFQDPHDWTRRQSHQASDSASHHTHCALPFGWFIFLRLVGHCRSGAL